MTFFVNFPQGLGPGIITWQLLQKLLSCGSRRNSPIGVCTVMDHFSQSILGRCCNVVTRERFLRDATPWHRRDGKARAQF